MKLLRKIGIGVLSLLCALTFAGCSACSSCASCAGGAEDLGGNSESQSSKIQPNELVAPVLSFDAETCTLSWTTDTRCNEYEIDYNGTLISVGKVDSYVIALSATENVFKVRAVGEDIYYTSAWSNAISYTVPEAELTTYQKINAKLAECAKTKGVEFVKVIGISYVSAEENRYGENFIFETICKEGKEEKQVSFGFGTETGETIVEKLNTLDCWEMTRYLENTTVDYDTAKYLVNDEPNNIKPVDGEMQVLKEQGYTMTVLSSCVREGKKVGSSFTFEVVATYKAVLGDQTRYFTSINKIKVTNPSSEDKNNYINCVRVPAYRTITETDFVWHEENGTMAYMAEWISYNDISQS